MTSIRVHGVKRATAKGHVYYYHRATGQRLQHDPDLDPAAFLAEVKGLDLGAPPAQPEAVAGSLGALIAAFKSEQNPDWLTLKDATRKSYNRVFDAVRELDELDLDHVDQPFLLGLRNTIFERSGRWLANYTVTVLSIVFKWGVPHGHVTSNPAAGVPKIRRAKGKGTANKAWTPDEVEAALKAAKQLDQVGVRKGIALAYYAGLRKADVVAVRDTARAKEQVAVEAQSKTDRPITIFEVKRLSTILDEPHRTVTPHKGKAAKPEGTTLVRRNDGQPYTADGFDSLFHRIKTDLVERGRIRAGLTFHGLRKSLGKRAADAGHSELDIAAALGQSNPASSRPYTIEAARDKGARRVFRSLNRKR
jgi:integrase